MADATPSGPKAHPKLVVPALPSWWFISVFSLGVLTIAANLIVIIKVCRKRRGQQQRKKERGGGGGGGGGGAPHTAQTGMVRFVDDVVLVLCIFNFVAEFLLNFVFSISSLMYRINKSETAEDIAASWLPFGMIFGWFPLFFHCYLASVTYNWLVRNHNVVRLRRGFKPAFKYILIAMAFQALVQVGGYYLAIWTKAFSFRAWARVVVVEMALVFFLNAGLVLFYYITTCWTILQRFRAHERVKQRHRKIVRRFLIIIGVFLVCSGCWFVYMFIVYTGQGEKIPLQTMLALLCTSHFGALADAVVLGNLKFKLRRCCFWLEGEKEGAGKKGASAGGHGDIPDPPRFNVRGGGGGLSSVQYLNSFLARGTNSFLGIRQGGGEQSSIMPDPAALFVTTYNLGPIKDLRGLGGKVSEWVPLGYDVYAIGLQECQCVEEIRAELHAHLGGPEAYHMFAAEVGPSTLLYGSIALTVFARSAHVASGAFAAAGAETSRVRNGVNLVVTKASNKGMAGLSFRYHDATLAFITCHFASDSGGKKRLRQRNEDARRTLRDVRLTDDEGFDVCLQHHHTFVFGDLNYRTRLNAHAVVERVVETVRRLESSVWQDTDDLPAAGEDGEGRADGQGGEWEVVGPEDYQRDGGHSDDDGDDDDAAAATAARVEEGQQSSLAATSEEEGETEGEGGVNWVSRAYMKLFAKPEDVEIVRSFFSLHKSVSGGGRSVVSKGILAEGDDEDIDSDEEDGKTDHEEGLTHGGRKEEMKVVAVEAAPFSIEKKEGTEVSHSESIDSHTSTTSRTNRLARWLSHYVPFFNSSVQDSMSRNTSSMNASSDAFSSFSSSTDGQLMFAPCTTAASLWSWVSDYDELKIEMHRGHVFVGFTEGPILFPPPFRWRRGGNAGDFTSVEKMAAAYVLKKKGDGERVPSYTDRILFHSLADVQDQLELVTYQMCDHVRGSDHRPISAAFRLHLNRQRFGFHTFTKEETTAAQISAVPLVAPQDPIEFSAASTWRVQLYKPQYKPYRLHPSLELEGMNTSSVRSGSGRRVLFRGGSGGGSNSSRSKDLSAGSPLTLASSLSLNSPAPLLPQPHWIVSFHFPCVLEDPFADVFKMQDMETVLVDRPAQPATRRCQETTWAKLSRTQGVTFDTLVLPEVSRHALVRLTDGQTGVEIGQGAICLRMAFASSTTTREGRDNKATQRRDSQRGFVHLLRRGGDDVSSQGVEVLISNKGKAVGMLTLKIKIKVKKG